MLTILVVDDDSDFQFLCKLTIKRSGLPIQIVEALDGQQALDLLTIDHVEVDLILLDINMPRMSGHEFLEAYAAIEPNEIPVVAMLTSSDQSEDREKAISYPFVKDYLVKPLKKDKLVQLAELVEKLKSQLD